MISQQSPESGNSRATLLLREQSPNVVAHLSQGCSSCAAGLEVFHRNDTPHATRKAVLDLFERELVATLQASGNAAQALHSALAGVATV